MAIKEIKKVVISPTLKATIKDADIRPIPIKGIELQINDIISKSTLKKPISALKNSEHMIK